MPILSGFKPVYVATSSASGLQGGADSVLVKVLTTHKDVQAGY